MFKLYRSGANVSEMKRATIFHVSLRHMQQIIN